MSTYLEIVVPEIFEEVGIEASQEKMSTFIEILDRNLDLKYEYENHVGPGTAKVSPVIDKEKASIRDALDYLMEKHGYTSLDFERREIGFVRHISHTHSTEDYDKY